LIRQHVSPRSELRPLSWAPWPALTGERPVTIREPESHWWQANPEADPRGTAPAAASGGAVTIAVVVEAETRWGHGAVVSRLAELAVEDELLLVYGQEGLSGAGSRNVIAGLRDHLPRHHLVVVPVPDFSAALEPDDSELLAESMEDGSLPVVVTGESAVQDIAAELATRLHADRVVRVFRMIDGVDVRPVWQRTAAARA
jgi:hypothetical protein